MYCELTGGRTLNQSPARTTFLSPAFTVSGKKQKQTRHAAGFLRRVTLEHGPHFCVCRLSHAGDVVVPGPAGDEGDHQQPGRLLHPAGRRPRGKRADLRALHRPAALLPLAGLHGAALVDGRGDEPPPVSPGEGRAVVGGPGRGVHQALLPRQGVLERPNGPTRRPAQQAGARKDLQTARRAGVPER